MQDLHKRLVSRLREKVKGKGVLVQELMDLLEISQDTVYRRLRGASEFTINELYKISRKFDLSIDAIFNSNIPSTNFRFNQLYGKDDNFMPYIANLTKQMEQLSKSKGTLTFVSSELPISQSFQNQGLREFKIYYWQKVVLNRIALKGVKFDQNFGLGININEYVDSLMHSYANMNKVEIWTEETIDDTIRQILYCRDSGLLDADMIQLVCESTLAMLDRLESELEMQSEVDNPHRLTFYVSSVELGNNVILMNFNSHRSAYVKFNTFNTVATSSDDFCNEIELMIKSNLTKCVDISGKSDIYRHRFFNILRSKVRGIYLKDQMFEAQQAPQM